MRQGVLDLKQPINNEEADGGFGTKWWGTSGESANFMLLGDLYFGGFIHHPNREQPACLCIWTSIAFFCVLTWDV